MSLKKSWGALLSIALVVIAAGGVGSGLLRASAAGPPTLGSAASFAVVAASTITNTGPTVLTGDFGLSPGTAVTGFPPGTLIGTQHIADVTAVQAQVDLTTAYNTAAAMTPTTDLTGQDLGGMTLFPGVDHFASSGGLTGTLTLDGQGAVNPSFVFQFGSTLTTASNSTVVLVNGAAGCGIFWQVGSSVTLGTGTNLQGNVIALASITMTTGANIDSGSASALNAAVTFDTNGRGASLPNLIAAGRGSRCQMGGPSRKAGHR